MTDRDRTMERSSAALVFDAVTSQEYTSGQIRLLEHERDPVLFSPFGGSVAS